MVTTPYQQLIIEGLQGLPNETLAEVADFVFFVRRRLIQPKVFDEELRQALLRVDLRQVSHDETAHLNEEFAGYEQRFPRE